MALPAAVIPGQYAPLVASIDCSNLSELASFYPPSAQQLFWRYSDAAPDPKLRRRLQLMLTSLHVVFAMSGDIINAAYSNSDDAPVLVDEFAPGFGRIGSQSLHTPLLHPSCFLHRLLPLPLRPLVDVQSMSRG